MPRKILVADDSSTIRRVVEHTFAGSDIHVLLAADGRAALELARREAPELVLCDVLMPGMSGYEVAEALHRTPGHEHVPVLLLTGAFEPFDEARAARCGALGFIAKPFESLALRQRVLSALASAPAAGKTAPAAAKPAPQGSDPYDPLDDADALLRRWGLEPVVSAAGPEPPPKNTAPAFDAYLDQALEPTPREPEPPRAAPEPQPWRPRHIPLPGDEDFHVGRLPVDALPPDPRPGAAPPPPEAPPAAAPPPAEPNPLAGDPTLEDVVRREVRRQVAELAPEILREVAWEVVPDLLERLLRAAAEGRSPAKRG